MNSCFPGTNNVNPRILSTAALILAGFISLPISSGCAATATPVPPTATSASSTSEPCAFNWAHHAVPALTDQLTAALSALKLTTISVDASAYGEDCIDMKTNKAISFGAMEMDFAINMNVDSLDNLETIGNQLAQVLGVINGSPRNLWLTSSLGRIDVNILVKGQVQKYLLINGQNLTTTLTGSALLKKLGF